MSDTRINDMSQDPSPPPRTLVLCFDGTNGQYGSMNTNVVKFYGLLCKDRPEQQATYYQAGIGTYFAPGIVSPLWTGLASLLDEAVAWYLDAHVMSGYKYLMENYRAGDKICLFGFSRGAYTARALAGMLNKVGLLQKDNVQQVNFAYKAYKRTDEQGIELAAGFKQTFSQDVKVDFVGVWDTVESTGVLINHVLPFTDSNAAIKVFRQVLSLDEHRARFRPNLYHWPKQVDAPGDMAGAADMGEIAAGKFHKLTSNFKRLFKGRGPRVEPAQQNERSGEVASGATQPETEFVAEECFKGTNVLEVWFAGCHSDVGGGNVRDDVQESLAQITLHWMVEQVMESDCGIIFNSDALARIGIKTPPLSPRTSLADSKLDDDATRNVAAVNGAVVQELSNGTNPSTPSTKAYPERADAIAPLFDQLKIRRTWWILEILPFSYAWQDCKGMWHSKWSINFGRGRYIPFQRPKFHHTVKQRMDDKRLDYKPRAIYDHNVVYV